MTEKTRNSTQGGTRIESARAAAIDAYDEVRARATNAGRSASEQIDQAPLMALAGGLAVGALIGAMLPRSRAEQRLLEPVGERLGDAGRAAVDAARTAGREKLDELNLTRSAGESVVQSIISGVGQAAKTSAEAAVGSVRDRK